LSNKIILSIKRHKWCSSAKISKIKDSNHFKRNSSLSKISRMSTKILLS
jgi:hypothetical protein